MNSNYRKFYIHTIPKRSRRDTVEDYRNRDSALFTSMCVQIYTASWLFDMESLCINLLSSDLLLFSAVTEYLIVSRSPQILQPLPSLQSSSNSILLFWIIILTLEEVLGYNLLIFYSVFLVEVPILISNTRMGLHSTRAHFPSLENAVRIPNSTVHQAPPFLSRCSPTTACRCFLIRTDENIPLLCCFLDHISAQVVRVYPMKAPFRKVLQGNPPSALIEAIDGRNILRFFDIRIEWFLANSSIAMLPGPNGLLSRSFI